MPGKSTEHSHHTSSDSGVDGQASAPQAGVRQPHGNAAAQEAMAAHHQGHGHAVDGMRNVGAAAGGVIGKAGAIQNNQNGVQIMKRLVADGLSKAVDPSKGVNGHDNLFHNAAEWVNQGQAEVVVLTPTHDSASRVSSPGDVAYFDKTSNWNSGGATYNESDLSDTSRIEIMSAGVLGTMSGDGKTLTMVDPVVHSRQLLIETLIHEVQHDADQHGAVWGEMPKDGSGEAPTWVYNSYMTEFRAYWLENPEGSASDMFPSSQGTRVTNIQIAALLYDGTTTTVNTAFVNERQEAIFKHMASPNRPAGDWWDYANNEWTQSYAYLGYYYAADPAYKAFVDKLVVPTSGNAIGSVRIQELSEALGAQCGGSDMFSVQMAIDSLDDLDHAFLADRVLSAPLWAQAKASLDPGQYIEFEDLMVTCQ